MHFHHRPVAVARAKSRLCEERVFPAAKTGVRWKHGGAGLSHPGVHETLGSPSGSGAGVNAGELWRVLGEVEKFSAISIRPMTLKRLIGLPNSTRQDILWS